MIDQLVTCQIFLQFLIKITSIYIYIERERERERKRDNIIIIKSLFNVGYIIAHTEKFTLIA